jgi:LysR family transcriptional activator of mexEF-oprN operon
MDLNLLVAFEALYAERSVTRAGRRLGLSQPATSGALGRLRTMLGDELFVRTPRGLAPTARGEQLAGPVARALQDLRAALDQVEFDPANEERTFTVGAVDAAIAVVLPPVAARVMKEAPRARLSIVPIDPERAASLLEDGTIDLALAPVRAVPQHLDSQELFRLDAMVAMRPGHPLAGRPVRLTDLTAYPLVRVSFASASPSPLDQALTAEGQPRRVAVLVSSFLAVPPMLRATDALAVLPAPFARLMAAEGQLAVAPLPAGIPFPDLRMRLLWSRRQDRSPASRWLRQLLLEVLRLIGP